MSYSFVQDDTLSGIADEIRNKTGNDDKITGENMAAEIRSIPAVRRMNNASYFENGAAGVALAQVAASYYFARLFETDKFVYCSKKNVMSETDSEGKSLVRTTVQGVVLNGETIGYGLLDCSAYAGLCLRGITYKNSPFPNHREIGATWTPAEELPDSYGTDEWTFSHLDTQPEGKFTERGIAGHSSLRFAADYAEFFYKTGYILMEGNFTQDGGTNDFDTIMSEMRPGDLVFYSQSAGTEAQKRRFKSITHIAIAGENAKCIYNVSGNSNNLFDGVIADENDPDSDGSTPLDIGLTISRKTMTFTNSKQVTLIIRPDLRTKKIETPIGENLLSYPYIYFQKNAVTSFVNNGITYTPTDIDKLQLSGTSTTVSRLDLKGSTSAGWAALVLSPGTYEVSGMTGTGHKDTGCAIQVRAVAEDGTIDNVLARCYDGTDPVTFTISEETSVYCRLYIANGYTLDCTVTPSLVRVS